MHAGVQIELLGHRLMSMEKSRTQPAATVCFTLELHVCDIGSVLEGVTFTGDPNSSLSERAIRAGTEPTLIVQPKGAPIGSAVLQVAEASATGAGVARLGSTGAAGNAFLCLA